MKHNEDGVTCLMKDSCGTYVGGHSGGAVNSIQNVCIVGSDLSAGPRFFALLSSLSIWSSIFPQQNKMSPLRLLSE